MKTITIVLNYRCLFVSGAHRTLVVCDAVRTASEIWAVDRLDLFKAQLDRLIDFKNWNIAGRYTNRHVQNYSDPFIQHIFVKIVKKSWNAWVRVLGDGAAWPNWFEKRFEVNSVTRPLVIARDDCYGLMTTLNSSELKRVQCTFMHIYRYTIMELWTNVLMLYADVYAMHVVVMWISHVTFECWFSLSYGAQPILAHKNRNRKLWKWNGVVNVL